MWIWVGAARHSTVACSAETAVDRFPEREISLAVALALPSSKPTPLCCCGQETQIHVFGALKCLSNNSEDLRANEKRNTLSWWPRGDILSVTLVGHHSVRAVVKRLIAEGLKTGRCKPFAHSRAGVYTKELGDEIRRLVLFFLGFPQTPGLASLELVYVCTYN